MQCKAKDGVFVPALQKQSTIAFRWDFVGSFFGVCVPDIISKLKNKTAGMNKMSINLYIMQWTVENARTKNW